MIGTRKIVNGWFAEVWLNRNQFYAYGDTEEEARQKLYKHMVGMAGVWEEKIRIEQQTLEDIKVFIDDFENTTAGTMDSENR